MTEGEKKVRAAAVELLERGQLSTDRYEQMLQGLGDADAVHQVERLAERLQRMPPHVVAGLAAGILLAAHRGDALAAAREVRDLERLVQATARRA